MCLRRAGGLPGFVWSLAAIAFGYAFFHRVTPSVMVSDLMTEFAIGGAMLGTLRRCISILLLQVPLGGMLPVFGTRRLLWWRCRWRYRSFLFGTAHSLEVAYLGRILIIRVECRVSRSLALASNSSRQTDLRFCRAGDVHRRSPRWRRLTTCLFH